MTTARVTRIVGNRGDAQRDGRTTDRFYETTSYQGLASIIFRDGQVVSKDWGFGHDGW